MQKGKLFTLLSLLAASAALGLAIYVLVSCEFYEVVWNDNGAQMIDMPGLFACKYSDETAQELPKNTMDFIALIALLAAISVGSISTLSLASFYFKWKFRVKNPGFSSCLYMLAVVCHGVTYVVLIGAVRKTSVTRTCLFTFEGYISYFHILSL